MTEQTKAYEAPGTDTHSLSFQDRTWEVITKLADANTGGNKSRLLTMLAHQASMAPDQFGLKENKNEELPSVNAQMRALHQVPA